LKEEKDESMATEYMLELGVIVVDVPLKEGATRPQETLKRIHLEPWQPERQTKNGCSL
jgi:hypothetical protein